MKHALSILLILVLPTLSLARVVEAPARTTVYIELEEQVTSKKKETSTGDAVSGHVWKDVWIDEQLVIRAGAPVQLRIASVKKAKMAGGKGRLEIEALEVEAVDGTPVELLGGYDGSGKGKVGLSVGLALAVAWPLIFLKGKQVVLEPGTLFDAELRSAVDIETLEDGPEPPPEITPDLAVTILYDRMDPDTKIKYLPLELEMREGEITAAEVVEVNGERIVPIAVELATPGAARTHGEVKFKPLSKEFRKGMNLFSVRCGEHTTEVMLESEL